MDWLFLGAAVVGVAGMFRVLRRRARGSGPLPADHRRDGVDHGRDPTAGARSNDYIATTRHGDSSSAGFL